MGINKTEFKGIVRITYSDGTFVENLFEGYRGPIGALEDAVEYANFYWRDGEKEVQDISLFLATPNHYDSNWDPKINAR